MLEVTRGRILLAVILISALFVVFHPAKTKVQEPPEQRHRTEQSGPKTTVIHASAKTNKTKRVNAPAPLTAEQCWDRINKQTVESEQFKSGLLIRMGNIIEPWFYRKGVLLPERPIEAAPSLFFAGLARAGLLEGRDEDEDIDKALALLKGAHELDPSNSAPLLFAAMIEMEHGDRQEAARLVELAEAGTTHFDSYVTTITKALKEVVRTPADYLSALSIAAAIPVPNYAGLKTLMQDYDPTAIAEQLMRDTLEPRNRNELFDYVSLEYLAGRSLLQGTSLASAYPSVKEIWEKKGGVSFATDRVIKTLEANCDISALQPFINE